MELGPALLAGLGLTVAAALVYVLFGVFFEARDRRWQRRHPGRSRIEADAPTTYDPSAQPEWLRGLGPDGQRLPMPPKRSYRDLLRDKPADDDQASTPSS